MAVAALIVLWLKWLRKAVQRLASKIAFYPVHSIALNFLLVFNIVEKYRFKFWVMDTINILKT
jgi:hypothetical protein